MRKRAHLLLLVSLALESSSCHWWFSKKKPAPPVATPLPAQPTTTIPPDPPALPLPPAKIGETPNPEPPNIPPEKIVTAPAPKRPARPVTRGRTTPPRASTTPATQEPLPPAPRLGQIFTPEQRNEYNRTLDESLDRVRKVLAAVQNRTLTDAQTEIVNRIRAFEKQAVQSREQDLVVATSLANRADVLARDLAAQLQ